VVPIRKFSFEGQAKAKKVSSHAEELVRTLPNITEIPKIDSTLGYQPPKSSKIRHKVKCLAHKQRTFPACREMATSAPFDRRAFARPDTVQPHSD
jgi:hypothetical protein